MSTKIDKQQWRCDVEALLTHDERTYLNARLATMTADVMDKAMRSSAAVAAQEVRIAKAVASGAKEITIGPIAFTTRREP
ncbi:MAG TPA: hypothetical protein VH143_32795 [Kofleriaceae bacterium]|nr:hypothetical protein [Kofleriaceae bacterium]